MFRIEKKTENRYALLTRILSALAAIASAGVIIAFCGYNPFSVYREMLIGSFGGIYYFQQLLEQMIPLLLLSLGVAVCFKMNFMNIGAEGQFCLGAVAATYIALHSQLSAPLTMVLMFAAAFLFGGLWCLIATALKLKWGVSETLVTLMLNYVALKLVSYLQNTLWKDPAALGFPKIANYPDELQLPKIFGVNAGWIAAGIILIFCLVLFRKMKLGYEINMMGANYAAALYGGIPVKKVLLLASMIGGGICGICGLIQASGVEHTLNESMSGCMGYTAVAIAYMAGMEPLPIAVVSFLFAILEQGGAYMQISMQISSSAADVAAGIILLFVLGSEFFVRYRIVRTASQKEGGVG